MTYIVYQDKSGEWRWRYKATNNKVVAISNDGYTDKDECLKSVELVKGSAKDLVIQMNSG